MKILLVAATAAEISPLIQHFDMQQQNFVSTEDFDLLITGVGMTATAFALGKHLPGNYELVLNLGIAGAFSRSLALTTVVNVTTDEFSELGAENGDTFLSIDELGFGKAKYAVSSNLHNLRLEKLPKVHGITVNRVHGHENTIKKAIEQSNPQIESMEGAAVLYCCEQENIPCVQVRSISNYVEVRNKANWQIGPAIKSLNDWAIGYLTKT